MNENLDLTQILKDCPKGTKLFCTNLGYVTLESVGCKDSLNPITVKNHNNYTISFTKDGFCFCQKYRDEYAEPSLFPAHDQRDWNKFEVPKPQIKVTLHPFDKVLVRDDSQSPWEAQFVTFMTIDGFETINGEAWCLGIPYNKDTARLLGTRDNCPIDYEIEFNKEFKEE